MKVANDTGRILEMSREDYERLVSMGKKFRIVEDEILPKKRKAKIGVFLQRVLTKEKYCASDRIRGEWIIKNCEGMEEWRSDTDYDAVIFHVPCKDIAACKGLKILDLCDSVWKNISNFKELINPVDAIVVSTEGLKAELSKITDKDIYVIGDGHDLEYYQSRIENKHIKKAREVVWFGYAQNAHCLTPYIRIIKENGLKLKAIAQCPLPPLDKVDKFVKWDVDTCIEEISKADFAILPVNGKLKSNNKDVTAYLSGIPVAKNEKDIIRLIDPKERKKDMNKVKELSERYDAKNKAKKYLKLIDSLKNDIEVYTSICGGYENDRDDITVITDDKFVDPVMNAKIAKVLSHKCFDSKYTIWVDGNIRLNESPKKIVELLGDADIAVFKHPYRNCIYEEHQPARERLPEEQRHIMDEQIEDYRKEGMPEKFGLAECGMIIRRNNDVVEEFNNRWWAEITRYQRRDQVSFPYVMWKMGKRIKVKFLDNNVRSHEYFIYENHHRS